MVIKHKKVGLEANAFYPTDPNESRWKTDDGPIHSWATRLSLFPSPNLSTQFSVPCSSEFINGCAGRADQRALISRAAYSASAGEPSTAIIWWASSVSEPEAEPLNLKEPL